MITRRFHQRAGGESTGHRAAVACGFLAALLAAGSAFGQCEQDKLAAADGAAEDYFGVAVAIEGDRAIVGVPQDDDGASNCGSACAFRFDGSSWVQDPGKLLAADRDAGDFFGFAVAISGDLAVIGAWGDDERGLNGGAAYVFEDSGSAWTCTAKLMAGDGQAADEFGRSVSILDDTVLVGAPGVDAGVDDAGAAYVFRREGAVWLEEAKLTRLNPLDGESMGCAVALGDDIALLGACHNSGHGNDAGAVHVFVRVGFTWLPQTVIYASDAGPGDQFGFSIATDGDAAIIGARFDGDSAYRAGSAYVFRYTPPWWVEQAKLLASDGAEDENFGYSVAMDGDIALIGARWDDDKGYHAGSAYAFRFDDPIWTQSAKLLAPDGEASDGFGLAVSLAGELALIGAWGDDDNGLQSGSAYAFELSGEDCNENGICDWRDIADGTSPDVNGNGIPDECENLCPADINGDAIVNVVDLLILLASWGPCPPIGDCLGDIDENGVVDVLDLLALLAGWGPCP